MRPDPADLHDDLHDDVLVAARAALAEARAAVGDDLRAMALYSDGGAMTICPSFDTHTHLAAAVAQEPEDAAYLEHAPEEWLVGPWDQAAFDDLSRRVAALNDQLAEDDEAFDAFARDLFETCVRVLEALRDDAGDLLLMFTVSDGGHPDEASWMRRTSPAHADRFAAYLASE